MANFPAFPIWTDAYIADTTHLSDSEHGRYLLMLIHMWRAPKHRFPNDDNWLARKFNRTVDDILTLYRPLLEEFFVTDGNWIRQKRLEKEFERVSASCAKQSARAKSRWNNGNGECRGTASPAQHPEPEPEPDPERSLLPAEESKTSRSESEIESRHCTLSDRVNDHSIDETASSDPPANVVAIKAPNAVPKAFEVFWNLYPRKVGKAAAQAAYSRARIQTADSELIAGLDRYRQWIERNDEPPQFVKHPATWLNKGCWQDELQDNQSRKGSSRVTETKDLLARFYARKSENGQTGVHTESASGVQLRISSLQEEHRRN